MEISSTLRGDKPEFRLVVAMSMHVRSCPSFDITNA